MARPLLLLGPAALLLLLLAAPPSSRALVLSGRTPGWRTGVRRGAVAARGDARDPSPSAGRPRPRERSSRRSSAGRPSFRPSSTSLAASRAAAPVSAPVERVAVIGAGIAGLAAAHALRSTRLLPDGGDGSGGGGGESPPIQIDVFDARPDLDPSAGSGIQLTGGLAALRAIDPALMKAAIDASLPLEGVVTRCRPWFGDGAGGGAEGWKVLELDVREAIRERVAADVEAGSEASSRGSGGREGSVRDLVTEEGEVLARSILRGALQDILAERLEGEHGVQVRFDKRLCGLTYSQEGNEGIVCRFSDGTQTGPYDLVIGCDGINSAVKRFVSTGEANPPSNPEDGSKPTSGAIYSGLRITFAVQEGEEPIDACRFRQYFGRGSYALTASYGAGEGRPPARGAFLIYPDKNYVGPFPKGEAGEAAPTRAATTAPADENADWTQDNRVAREHVAECLEILESAFIPGEEAREIIEKSNRFFDLGVYLHNPFSLNGWVREVPREDSGGGPFAGWGGTGTGRYAVLAGDAAHAMPPFLGQGANQALQDACALARRVHEHNAGVRSLQGGEVDAPLPDLGVRLKEYERRRWLPTTSITAKAAFLGYLEVGPSVVSNFRDAFFFVMGKIGVAKKVFLDAATPKM